MLTAVKTIVLSHTPDWMIRPVRDVHHLLALRGSQEPEFELISDLVRPGDTVLDVGANVGVFTHQFSKLVGARGKVIAIEPAAQNVRVLRACRFIYRLSNVQVVHAAASDTECSLSFEVPTYAWAHAPNYYPCRVAEVGGAHNFSVRGVPLDSFRVDPSLIKIDVEGHELAVLKGALQTIVQYRPLLLVEVSNPAAADYLFSLGYRARRISANNVLFQPG